MSYKEDIYDKRAKKFIATLRGHVNEYIKLGNEYYMFWPDMEILRKLFDSFAIIDKFSSFLIINCYHELKISLMKIERFGPKDNNQLFKNELEEMYEVMEDLYFYEYFGFFSTSLGPKRIPGLPCHVSCGCTSFWVVEPCLTDDGKVAYENVIRFKDPESKKFLCITISKTPRLLEDRKKCSLSDEQLGFLENFVINNREILILHACDYMVLDSCQLDNAIQVKDKTYGTAAKYRIAYTLKNRLNSEDNTAGCYYVGLEDMSYDEAVKVYKEIQEEMEENAGKDEEFDIYGPYALASIEILRPE